MNTITLSIRLFFSVMFLIIFLIIHYSLFTILAG